METEKITEGELQEFERRGYTVNEDSSVIGKAGKVLKIHKGTCGYYQINTWDNSNQKTFLLHRIVALKYVPNPDNLPEVNHAKIQSIDITPSPNYSGYRIEIVVQGYVKIEGFPMPTIMTNVAREGSLIKAIWQAVVQFIQWYSNNSLK